MLANWFSNTLFLVTAYGTTVAALTMGDASYGTSTLSSRQAAGGFLPSTFQWTSTGPLIGPKNDGRDLAGIKDPSIVEINGTYHVFASTSKEEGYNLVYFRFTDFDRAGDAEFHYLDQAPLGPGYRAAPQVFWFEPHKLWYLVYQNGNAAYSTNPDINDPKGWTEPKTFYPKMPSIIEENIGGQYWVDMWVICDETKCHLFSSDDNGHLYRSETSLADFPNGMSEPVMALSDPDRFRLFEAACIYRIKGPADHAPTYLLLVEAIGSDGHRWFRAWTAPSIASDNKWIPLAVEEDHPFMRSNNVVFSASNTSSTDAEPWTKSISHGEMIRSEQNIDQTMTLSPCNMRFLYQGLSPAAEEDKNLTYNALPWRLALLTQRNSAC